MLLRFEAIVAIVTDQQPPALSQVHNLLLMAHTSF